MSFFFFAKAKFFPGNWQMNVLRIPLKKKKNEDGGEVQDVFGATNMGILGCTVVRENDKAAAQQQTATHAMA